MRWKHRSGIMPILGLDLGIVAGTHVLPPPYLSRLRAGLSHMNQDLVGGPFVAHPSRRPPLAGSSG